MLPRDTSQTPQTHLAPGNRHSGTALALLSVMLLYWAVLLGAELRVLRAWVTQPLPVQPSAAAAAGEVASSATSLEAASDELTITGNALRTFGWAQIAAGLGATAALVHLLARRNGSWFVVTAMALASISDFVTPVLGRACATAPRQW